MPTVKKEIKNIADKAVKKAIKKTVVKVEKKTTAKKAVRAQAVKKAIVKKTATSTTNKATDTGVAKAKSAVKSPAKKKNGSVKVTKELFIADDSTCFWLTDGQILNSLLALRDALENMNEEVYRYHVGNDHNDFSDWVGAVLCDEDCARDLESANTPQSAKSVVIKHLKFYVI